jgi:hypothetical protein
MGNGFRWAEPNGYGGVGNNAVDRDLFASVLVAGELRRGVESIRRRDRPAGDGLAEWLITLLCSRPSAALCM